jgi:Survival motor neuron (SMN) interacting protein 1 (SIP1)
MPKRKRQEFVKPKFTAGPLDETTGQRSVFPEVAALSSERDSEWQYDGDENGVDEGYIEDEDSTMLDASVAVVDESLGPRDEGSEKSPEEGESDDEVEEDEWEVEPQTEAISYLHSVRAEAEGLPGLAYVAHEDPGADGVSIGSGKISPGKADSSVESENTWRTQFLKYYYTLRETIINAPEPNLSQDELDVLLHINPNKRPTTSNQEDSLWRLKTLDQPSITLLSMLDHQRTIHVLIHLRKKISANAKAEQCMWLVFLLARLGDLGVLNGDEVDLLRRIGKKCLTVRGSLGGKGDKVVLGTVDMVVCIIKHYYQQKDLEEAFEASNIAS